MTISLLSTLGKAFYVLCRGGNVAASGQIGEESGYFGFAHIGGVPLVVEYDVAVDPIDIGVLGADGIVADADFLAYAIEQLRLSDRFGCQTEKFITG